MNGTNGDDVIAITGSGTSASVNGLQAAVNITDSEGANDRLTINAQGGDDVVNASGLEAGVIAPDIQWRAWRGHPDRQRGRRSCQRRRRQRHGVSGRGR